jgi:hypothetical protein
MNYLKNPDHPTWVAHSRDLKKMMGLMTNALGCYPKWPAEGMEPRQIQGFTVWVNPLDPNEVRNYSNRRSNHRVMARCLVCGKEMSAGRTAQHKCVEK